MKASELRERMMVKPFRPFTIETAGGQSFPVVGEESIFLPIPKPEIAIVFLGTQMFIIDIDSINVLAIK